MDATSSGFLPERASNATWSFEEPAWSTIAIIHVSTTVLANLLNAFVLIYYVWYPRLRSDFAVYLMALLIANVAYAVLADNLSLISLIYVGWPIGKFLCSMKQYALWVLQGLILWCHSLITVNRIWALFYPLSYRNHHSKKIAIAMVCAVTVCVHIVGLPGVVLEGINRKGDIEKGGCHFGDTGLVLWKQIVILVIYDLPIIFPIAVYPFLWLQYQTFSSSHASARPSTTGKTGREKSRTKRDRPSGSNRKKFLMLTILTVSTAICWSPLQFYYTVTAFSAVSVPLVHTIGETLYAMESVLDAIYILVTMQDLKDVVRRSVCRSQKSL